MKKFKIKLKSLFLIATSSVIFIAASYSLFKDVNYFLTKKEAWGTILELKKGTEGNDLKVKVRYFNEYQNKIDTCKIFLENSYWDNLVGLHNTHINYSRGSAPTVYLKDIKSPYFAVIFLDLLLLIITPFTFYAGLKDDTEARPNPDNNL